MQLNLFLIYVFIIKPMQNYIYIYKITIHQKCYNNVNTCNDFGSFILLDAKNQSGDNLFLFQN